MDFVFLRAEELLAEAAVKLSAVTQKAVRKKRSLSQCILWSESWSWYSCRGWVEGNFLCPFRAEYSLVGQSHRLPFLSLVDF